MRRPVSVVMRSRSHVGFGLQGGTLEVNGQKPLQLGVTRWRTLVTYVPQTRVHPAGTPAEFYFSVQVQCRMWCMHVSGMT